MPELARRIDAVLPQTQCTRCGYPACRPYADAIAQGEADINQCPPGGDEGIHRLAKIAGRPYQPLNPKHGISGPLKVALIDESRCIGCALCLIACPVDAIVGGIQFMHTVIADECTGCELCISPCPVDCIEMVSPPTGPRAWSDEDARSARQRFTARNERIAQTIQQSSERLAKNRLTAMLDRAKARGLARAKARP